MVYCMQYGMSMFHNLYRVLVILDMDKRLALISTYSKMVSKKK